MGRTTDYNTTLAREICARIALGTESLKNILESEEKFPSLGTFYDWMNKFPEFRNQVEAARLEKTNTYAERIADVGEATFIDDTIDPERAKVLVGALDKSARLTKTPSPALAAGFEAASLPMLERARAIMHLLNTAAALPKPVDADFEEVKEQE